MTRGGPDGAVRHASATVASLTPLAVAIGVQLWRNLPGLLRANLVFLAWCAPYGLLALLGLPAAALAVAPITVGPGLVGLMTLAARVARDEPLGGWSAGLRAGRACFRTGSVLATALLVAWHAQLVALRAVVDQEAAGSAVLIWAAQLAVLVVGALGGVHALGLVGLYQQGALEATRNAFILAVRHPGPTVAMLGLVGAAGPLTWTLGGAPLVILPAALAVCLVNGTRRLVDLEGAGR